MPALRVFVHGDRSLDPGKNWKRDRTLVSDDAPLTDRYIAATIWEP